jgi:ATP-binding cassette subfamily C protein
VRFAAGEGLAASLTVLVRDVSAYAGRKGIRAGVLVLSGAMLEGIGLALIAPMLAVLFGGSNGNGRLQRVSAMLFDWTGLTTLPARLALLLGVFVVAMIVRAVVLMARDATLAELRIGFVELQRCRVAEDLAAASWSKVVRLRHARVIQVMSGDIQQIGVAAFFLTQCLTSVVMLAAQCVLALWLSLPLALLSFVLLIASGLALFPTMRRANALGKVFTNASQILLHGTSQFLGGLKLAVSQNLQSGYLAEFRATIAEQSEQQIRYLRQQTASRLAIATVSAVVGALLVLAGLTVFHVAPAMLVALLLVVARMSGPSGQIQQGAQMLANALPAYDAVRSLRHDLEDGAMPIVAADDAQPVSGEIRFDQVTFAHPQDGGGEAHGVHDLTLTIAPGTCLGIKGASGAGKTTFADLLAGLYPPQSGTITVDGEPLGAMLGRWRNSIAYVAQDPFLFYDTIRRNLAWADPSADESRMWQALDLVEASGFIRALPAGLDTVVGERGTLISGGERQRIALARAVLRRAKLLILDEATNALDPATETAILDRLRTLDPRPTLVIIAHRPDSLNGCDRVLTMSDGRLA